jgi:hypothetical protein
MGRLERGSAARVCSKRSAYRAKLNALPDLQETELVDLNGLKPEPIASPEWARHW